MAQADSSLSKNVEQELTCAVCCELYSCPLLLQCSHSFCKKCLKDLERNEGYYSSYRFKCPVCRTPSRSGIDRLPENLALSNLVTVLKTNEGRRAVSATPIPTLNSTECWKHPNNDLDQYCVYCLKAFCSVCPKLKCDTEKHWLKPLDVQWKTTWESLTALSGEVGDRMSSLSDRMQLLDDQLAAVDREEDTVKSELTSEIEVLKSILISRLTRLNTDLHSEVQDIKYPLTYDRQKCSAILDRMERLSSEMQDLHRCNNGVKSLKRITELEKEISSLVRQESRDMLQRAIPVVTMPTWKLVRSPVEAAIRNLIVRRTNPVASDSVSRVGVSPTSPMRTSPDRIPQPQSRRGELDSDVTMWMFSTPQSQLTRQTPGISQDGRQRTTRVRAIAQRSSASTSMSVSSNNLSVSPTGASSSSPREDTSVSASSSSALTDCYNSIETSLKKLEVSAKHFTLKGSEHVAKMLKKETKGFKGYQTTCPNSFHFGSGTVFGSGGITGTDTVYSNPSQAPKQWGSVFSAPSTTVSFFGNSSNPMNVDFSGRGISSSPSRQRATVRGRHQRTGGNTGFKLNFTNGDPFSTKSVPEAFQPKTLTLGSSSPSPQSNASTGKCTSATKCSFPTSISNGGSFSVIAAAKVPHSGPERSNLTVAPNLPEQSGRSIDVNFTSSSFQCSGVFFAHPDSTSQGTVNTATSQHYVPSMNSLWTNGHYVDNTVTVMSPGYGLPLSTTVPGSSRLQPMAFSAQPHAGLFAPAAYETSTPTQYSESYRGNCDENVSKASTQVLNSESCSLGITTAAKTLDTNTATPSSSSPAFIPETTLNSITGTLGSSIPTQVPDSATTQNPITTPLSSSIPTQVSDLATTPNPITTSLSSSIPTQVPDSATTQNPITTPLSSSIPTQVPDSATTPNPITTPLSSSIPTQVSDLATTPNPITTPLSSSLPTQVPDSTTTQNPITTPLSSSIPTQVPDSATTLVPNRITTTLSSSIPTQVPDLATASMSSSTGTSEPTVNTGPDISNNSSMVSSSTVPVQPSDSRCSTPCQDERSLPGNHHSPPLFGDSDRVITKDKQSKNPNETITAQKSDTGGELFVNDNNSIVQQTNKNQVVSMDRLPPSDASSTSSSTAATGGSFTVSPGAFQLGQPASLSVKSDNSQGMFTFGNAMDMSRKTCFSFTPVNVSANPELAQASFPKVSFPSDVRKAAGMQTESQFQFAVPRETGFQFGTPTSSVGNNLVFGFPFPKKTQ
ncbi:uncharacterized protein [Haliotis asinina]|uniref:uncharacterized protein n=1 Tax=Haliotis asinina TaxID=109174 RepID=UPI00353235F2